MIDISEDLDLYPQTIRITRRSKDYSEIESREGEFVRTFTGPATRKNQSALQNYGIIGAQSDFNPHVGIPASWSFDGIQRFTGRLEVNLVKYKDGEPNTFHFTFYGRQRGLSSVFGSARLSDVDWSEYDHVINWSNVFSSWVEGLFDGELHYPLIDTRQGYFFGPDTQDVQGNISNSQNGIVTPLLRPGIAAQVFLKGLFSKFGLELIGDLVDSTSSFLYGAYLLINRHSGESEDPALLNENFVSVSGGTTASLGSPNTSALIVFGTVVQDEMSQYAGGTYTAQQQGVHKISGQINVLRNGTGSPGAYQVQFRVNGITVHFIQQITTPDYSPAVFIVTYYEIAINLSIGDELEVYFARVPRVIGPFTFNGSPHQVIGGIWKVEGPLTTYGQTISVTDQMTDEPIVEWLSKVIESWNLVLVPERLNVKQWRLISAEDWKEEGELRDWSQYIDLKEFDYRKPNVYKRIRMRYERSDAAVQDAFRAQSGRNYGELLLNTGVEFGEDELEVVNPCTIIPPSLFRIVDAQGQPTLDYADVTIHKSINIEGKPVKEQYLLYYYNGVQPTAWRYYLQNSGGIEPTSLPMNIFPHISSTRAVISTTDSETLTYSIEAPLLGDASTKTRYFDLWWNQIQVQFAPGSRVMEGARFVIPSIQFLDYELNDEIYVEGQYYRILEISHDQDGREAMVSLTSSRLGRPLVRPSVLAGGKMNGTFSSELDKSEAGANEKDGEYYAGFTKARTIPNTLGYIETQQTIVSEVISEINTFGGRFRKYVEEEESDGESES